MLILSLLSNPIKALGFILGLIIAITVHEFMHGFVAFRLGDPTPSYEGRLTLNPIKHLDPFGTLFLFLVGFGWGKPVLINPLNFKNPRFGELLVALSGPFSNLVVAALFSISLRFGLVEPVASIVSLIIFINLMLCAFNLLPIPPLDGSKLLWIIFPKIDMHQLERVGVSILFFVLIASYLTGYPIFSSIIMPIINFLAKIIGAGNISI